MIKNLSLITFICVILFIVAPTVGGNNAVSISNNLKSELEKHEDYMFLNWNIPITIVDMNIEFYKQSIPEAYAETFLKATESRPDLRMVLFAMMRLETQEFTHYVSHKPNDNGTMDYGPLMLNSDNIKSEEFRNKYYPKDDFWTDLDLSNLTDEEFTYNVYMVACVNLFIAHMKTYEKGPRWEQLMKSIKAYNAGPKVLRQKTGKAVRRANAYYNKIVKNIESSKLAFNEMAEMYKTELDPRVFEVVW